MELLGFSQEAFEEGTTPRKWTFGIKREECSTEKLRPRKIWREGAVMGAGSSGHAGPSPGSGL